MFENKTALIVEGDAHSLLVICSILDGMEIRYKRNTSGLRVLQQVSSMNPRPDFILLDIDLPLADAFAICEALKYEEELRDIPVIALAAGDMLKRVECSAFTETLPKPLSHKDFRQVIQHILGGGV